MIVVYLWSESLIRFTCTKTNNPSDIIRWRNLTGMIGAGEKKKLIGHIPCAFIYRFALPCTKKNNRAAMSFTVNFSYFPQQNAQELNKKKRFSVGFSIAYRLVYHFSPANIQLWKSSNSLAAVADTEKKTTTKRTF